MKQTWKTLLIITVALFWTTIAHAETKVIDINNWEHRFAILKAIAPPSLRNLEPIPKEHRKKAILFCVKLGIQQLNMSSTPMLPAALGVKVVDTSQGIKFTPGIICLSGAAELDTNNNLGWRDICKVFGLEFVYKPSETSVLCINKRSKKAI